MFPVSTVVASICQERRGEGRNYKTSVFTGNIMVLPLVFSSLLVDVSLDHTTNNQTNLRIQCLISPERRRPATPVHCFPLHMWILCSHSPVGYHETSLTSAQIRENQINASKRSPRQCSDLHVVLLADDLSVSPGQTRTDCRNRLADPAASSVIHNHVKSEGEHLVILENMEHVERQASGIWRP